MVEKPSEEFLSAIRHSSSIVISCEHCDRTHFSLMSGDFEDGELEELVENEKRNPDKFIGHNEDSISWGNLAGKQYVLECPCNTAAQYEALYWNDRHLIARYLDAKAKKIRKTSDYETNLAQKVKEASDYETSFGYSGA